MCVANTIYCLSENYDYFAENFDRIIAVDWPGMGCSSRSTNQMKKLSWLCSMPSILFNKISKEEYALNLARQVTDEFVDALEALRQEEELTDFVLAGHSLGGFLAGKYALKYPKHLKGLVLISPVGIPHPPPKEQQVSASNIDWRIRMVKYLWDMNFTPQSIVRIAGSRGPELVKTAIDRRFARQWEATELKVLSDYLYQITALPASGEYCLNTLLEPIFTQAVIEEEQIEEVEARQGVRKVRTRSGVYAKDPMEKQLCDLKVPLLLIYGDNDWLYYPTAAQSIHMWKRHGVDAELKIIPNAGHHLYIDNAPHFNHSVVDWAKRRGLLG